MSGTSASAVPKRYRRLTPADRRRQIIEAAIGYFAEHGFEGATRGLAERLGVTQPLIYRYFPSKQDLIQAVYEEVYLSRWRGEWIDLLSRREQPLRDRLIAFYEHFASIAFRPEWMRIYLFSGLRRLDINRWWIAFVEDHVLTRICEEVRHVMNLPGPCDLPITAEEIDGYWLFHGGIFYQGIREHVYGIPARVKLERFIALSVDSFLAGFPKTIAAALADAAPAAAPRPTRSRSSGQGDR